MMLPERQTLARQKIDQRFFFSSSKEYFVPRQMTPPFAIVKYADRISVNRNKQELIG